MKAKSLVLVIFCMCGVSANAQFSVGVKGGLNASSIEEYGAYSLDTRAGFHAGIMAQYMFDDNWGLESGLYYSLLGGSEKEWDYDHRLGVVEEDYMATANPSYLQLPVYAIYKFRVGNDIAIYPNLGLYLGYGLGGKYDVKGVRYNYQSRELVDVAENRDFFDDNTNRLDMGVGAGLNLQYKKFVVGLGYEQGFLKINKHRFSYGNEDAYNSNMKLSVGFMF